jgi:hypothetical protein
MPRGRRKRSGGVLFRSAEWIGWALGGLEREITETKSRLSELTSQAAKLRARLGTRISRAAAAAKEKPLGRRRRRRMSAEGRRRISAMMKKRWAEAKKKNRNRL